MSRHTNNDRRSSLSSSHRTIDQRISQIGIEINEFKQKIDTCIAAMNIKIEHTLTSKLHQQQSKHRQLVADKQKEIMHLVENIERLKNVDMLEHQKTFKKTLQQCRDNMQRMSDLLTMFKKEAEKYKIEIDIKEKELFASKEREKKLIKKIWVLQENIKDIYSQDYLDITRNHNYSQVKTQRSRTRGFSEIKTHQNTSKTIYTQKVSMKQRTELKKVKDQQLHGPKISIYDKTNLKQEIKKSHLERYVTEKSQIFDSDVNNPINLQVSSLSKQVINPSFYNQLRNSVRKVDRLQQDLSSIISDPQMIGIDEYRLIAVNSLKVMSQIQKIVIEKYGQLKIVDSQSIKLLNELFSNPNTVKILEIILFNYSRQALRKIRKSKEKIIIQHFYSQPSIDSLPQEKPVKINRPPKYKIDLAIRKNFKNNFTYRKLERDLRKSEVQD